MENMIVGETEAEKETLIKKGYRIPSKKFVGKPGKSKLLRNSFRNFAKRFYSQKKWEERSIGIRISQIINELHYEKKQIKKQGIDDEAKKYLDVLVKELFSLRQAPRFVKDFPTFNGFWRFIILNKLVSKDLLQSEE